MSAPSSMLQASEARPNGKVPDYPTDQFDSLLEPNNTVTGNGTAAPVIIVRAEEVLIVMLVLVLWVAAIALFFNRWGKIRMLEPYQPKFQAHRPSCPLVEIDGPIGGQSRTFSKCNMNGLNISDPLARGTLRPRQNSVFVGGSATMLTLPNNAPRRAKSAMDIQTLVTAEYEPGSFNPLPEHRPNVCSKFDVRPIELPPLRKLPDPRRPSCIDMRRPSCVKPPCTLEIRKPCADATRRPLCDARRVSCVNLDTRRTSCVNVDVRKTSCVSVDLRKPSCSKLLDKSLLVSQV